MSHRKAFCCDNQRRNLSVVRRLIPSNRSFTHFSSFSFIPPPPPSLPERRSADMGFINRRRDWLAFEEYDWDLHESQEEQLEG